MIIGRVTAEALAEVFRGLSDPNRVRIVALLLDGERCGCEIQACLGLSQSNVSRHLSYLKHAGLVCDQRRGQRVYHRLADSGPELLALFDFLRQALGKAPRGAGGKSAVARRRLRPQVRRRSRARRMP